ncbi:translation elongation factor Ts [Ureaplasma parvum]|uniref:translation elongation factor Ts n=1 Tax=Ureaplasma parvum TaxID=134821 RepID=UPI0026E9CDCE|nr:translation elongation factor Ts [Ureaplasma parvum]
MTKAELVKELRIRTQASMSECIKALDASENDIEKAIVWLRENGAIKAANKLKNAATDGVVLAKKVNNKAILIEVNCQTDFVAKNENFLAYANQILEEALVKVENKEDFDKLIINGKPIAESGLDLTAYIGEKIVFRRGEILKANDDQTLGVYTHNNNRVAAIILVDGKVEDEVVRNVAMHAAAMRPRYLNEKVVDKLWLAKEREIIVNQLEHEGKPAAFAAKIIDGRLNKILKENCLVDQSYFKQPELTIEKYLKNNNAVAVGYFSYEVGEGIEKAPQMSFADEVAAQMKK